MISITTHPTSVSFPVAKHSSQRNIKEKQALKLTPISQSVIDDSTTVDDFFESLNEEISCRYGKKDDQNKK